MKITKQVFFPVLIITLILIAVGLTAFAATYPDEIAYKIFLERYFINGGFKQSMTPFCSEGFLVKPALSLVPAAMFWSVISYLGHGWLSYRIVPYIGLLIIYVTLLVHNFKKKNRSFWPLFLLITMGPVLYGLVLLRAEILILAIGMLVFALGHTMCKTHQHLRLYLYSFGMLALFSLAAYVHPKATYLFAVVAVSIIMASAQIKNIAHKICYVVLFIVGTLWITQNAIGLHQLQFMSCKSQPNIEHTITNTQSVNPIDLFKNPVQFTEEMKLAFSKSALQNTADRMSFQIHYQIGYLPDKIANRGLDIWANFFIQATVIGFIFYIILKSIACLLFLKAKQERKHFYLVMALSLSLLTPFLLNITKHFYEIAFFICALMIVATLLWPFKIINYRAHVKYFWITLSVYMISVSALCIALDYNNFTLKFLQGYAGPSISFSSERKILAEEISKALLDAQVAQTEPLIVDDLTYETVKNHPIVVPVTYLTLAAPPSVVSFYLDMFHVHYGVTQCVTSNGVLKHFVSTKNLVTIKYAKPFNSQSVEDTNICLFKVM